MSNPQPAPDPGGEQEVDLASAWQRLKVRWWLPVGGLVAGAIVGLAFGVAGGQVWQAKTIVYLGQPFTVGGGGQIQSLATNPRTVNEIVHAESTLRAASAASGIPVSTLRNSISTKALTEAGQLKGVNPLIEIAVKGHGRRKVESAADALSRRVVGKVSVYVRDKVGLLTNQINQDEAQIAVADQKIKTAQEQQAALVSNSKLTLVEKLLASNNLNSVIAIAEERRTSLQGDVNNARQLLNLAQSVESSRLVESASGVKTSAHSTRISILVGALIGLVVGAVAALAAEPIAARRRAAANT